MRNNCLVLLLFCVLPLTERREMFIIGLTTHHEQKRRVRCLRTSAGVIEIVPSLPTTAAPLPAGALLLTWRVHLLRRRPERLPLVVVIYLLAIGSVWLMFGSPLPVCAALLLLTGAISEYLFPIEYRLTEASVAAAGGTSKTALRWQDVRRVVFRRSGVLLTALPAPSRLDSFRGVFLRYAPHGEPGDKDSLAPILSQYLPDLLPERESDA